MSVISDCQNILVAKANDQGYLTFDDILDTSDAFNLSVSEVDKLSEAIQLLGIIVYESAPEKKPENSDEGEDYSRTDYEAIYAELVQLSDNLEPIINEIRQYPTPQFGEINLLARQISSGNSFARERLITMYMRTALKIALSMTKQYQFDIEEAVSASFIGLCTAVDRYDPDGFSVFHSYASLWIQQNIQRECTPLWMDYYFPAHYKEKMFKVLQRYSAYCGDVFDDSIDQQIIERVADDIEMAPDDVSNYLNSALQQIVGKTSLEDCIDLLEEDPENPIPGLFYDDLFENIQAKVLRQEIESVLETLTEREAAVLRMRNGMDNSRPMTLEEVGTEFNVTRERVRQIEAKALRKLSHPSRAKRLKDFL